VRRRAPGSKGSRSEEPAGQRRDRQGGLVKTISWILGFIALALIGYLLYHFFEDRRRSPDAVYYEVNADSVQAFRDRAGELRRQSKALKARLEELKLWERPAVQARIEELDRQVDGLDQAVERWEMARRTRSEKDLYRQCVLLYGQASGMCDALAMDTLPPKP
jgi:hypothetical protein